MYGSTHIQNLFDISYETVRTYTKEFGRYLSPTARPPKGDHRKYTYDDLKVFAQIVGMKRDRKVYADIHAALAAGERTEIPEFSEAEIKELALSRQGVVVAQELQKARERIMEMEAKIVQFEKQTPELRDEVATLKGQLEELRRQHENTDHRFMEAMKSAQQSYAQGFKDGAGFSGKKSDAS